MKIAKRLLINSALGGLDAPRANKLNPAQQEIAVEAYTNYGTLHMAAKSIGTSRRSLARAIKADEEFAQEMEQAKLTHIDLLENILFERIQEGKGRSDLLLMFKLKAELPNKYRDNVTQRHEGTINLQVISGVPRPVKEINEDNHMPQLPAGV